MACSITVAKGVPELELPDLFDIRDRQANLLCTVFGLHVAERLAALITRGLEAGKDSYGVVFGALSQLDCELVAKTVAGGEHWWAVAEEADWARAEVISALMGEVTVLICSHATADAAQYSR